jgi:hypothetical protein
METVVDASASDAVESRPRRPLGRSTSVPDLLDDSREVMSCSRLAASAAKTDGETPMAPGSSIARTWLRPARGGLRPRRHRLGSEGDRKTPQQRDGSGNRAGTAEPGTDSTMHSRPSHWSALGTPGADTRRTATRRPRSVRDDDAGRLWAEGTESRRHGPATRRGAVLEEETQAHGSIEQSEAATLRGATDATVEQGLEVEDQGRAVSSRRGNALREDWPNEVQRREGNDRGDAARLPVRERLRRVERHRERRRRWE